MLALVYLINRNLSNRSNRFQLDISSFNSRFQLNSGICFIPRIPYDRWGVSFHCMLHRFDSLAIVLILEWLSLKHQVFCRRQGDDIKSIRDNAGIVRCHFDALYIFGCVRFPIFLRQSQTNRFSAKGFHAGEDTPDITAYLLTIAPILFCCFSSLDNNFAFRLLNYLNKDICDMLH